VLFREPYKLLDDDDDDKLLVAIIITYILNDLNITADTCRKCQGKKEIIQRITCYALTPGDYTHCHN